MKRSKVIELAAFFILQLMLKGHRAIGLFYIYNISSLVEEKKTPAGHGLDVTQTLHALPSLHLSQSV